MSYDIFYGKQFVLLRKTREVIPMFLAGSNNCYEIGVGGRNGRRSRSWDNFRYYNRKGKISEKPDVILKNLDIELGQYIRRQRKRDDGGKPAHVKAHFGYYAAIVVGSGHCSDTSWNMWRSQFANGIRGALTIEELNTLGINLIFRHWNDNKNGMPASVAITTEREYFTELNKWRAWQNNGGSTFSLSFRPSSTDRVLEKLRAAKRKPPREKTIVEQDHYFVLTNGNGNLVKYTSRGYRYSYSQTGGKQFMTEESAEKYQQQLLKNNRYQSDTWKVKRVELLTTFRV